MRQVQQPCCQRNRTQRHSHCSPHRQPVVLVHLQGHVHKSADACFCFKPEIMRHQREKARHDALGLKAFLACRDASHAHYHHQQMQQHANYRRREQLELYGWM